MPYLSSGAGGTQASCLQAHGSGVSRASPGEHPGVTTPHSPQGADWVDSSPASTPPPALPAVRAVRGPSPASPACGSLRGARKQSAVSEAGKDQTRRVMGMESFIDH